MEYTLGQQVRIHADIADSTKYPNKQPQFTTDMRRRGGRILTIRRHSNEEIYELSDGWNWHTDWFAPVVQSESELFKQLVNKQITPEQYTSLRSQIEVKENE
jgi:hypothetical protein